MAEQRRLAAILAADMVGYSRLMEADESGTIARQKAHRAELIDPKITEHNGRIVKTTGDGILVEFASVVDAFKCAVAIQITMSGREADHSEHHRIQYRIGINIGDIVVDGDDIFGDGVNVAARIEGLCQPGEVYLSGAAYDQVNGKVDLSFENLGEQSVKNISNPIKIYRVKLGILDNNAPKSPEPSKAQNLSDKPSIAVLPFDNLSSDPEQEYFADGIAEDIITALSRFRWFFVIARNSSFAYKGRVVDLRTVGQELG
ncbi:MAG: adenylate/guanylate cyclase domain-containing protein, partial [Desulfobulbia bacterium]